MQVKSFKKLRALMPFLFLFVHVSLIGQDALIFPKTNSPYSRFGIGNIIDQYFAASAGMGGLSATFNDPFHLNLVNPASLASLKATAFEVGLFAELASLESESGEQDNIWTGNLGYLALGFPLVNPINRAVDRSETPWDFGMSLALTPYSIVGYDIISTVEDENFGLATNSLKGNGGSYRFTWGNAIKYKNLAFGLTLGYQFGKITNNRRVQLDSLTVAYNVDFSSEQNIGGVIWKAGVQYIHAFKDPGGRSTGKRLILGGYGNTETSLNTRLNETTFGDNINYGIFGQDTISFVEERTGSGVLPAEIGLGVMYEDFDHYRIGIDYQFTGWSNFENDFQRDVFGDSWRLIGGAEWIPNSTSINSYWARVRYRLGTFVGKDYRISNGNQLNEWGFSFGVGFPIIVPRTQRFSFVNFALEYSRLGIEGGLKESYLKLNFGFTLNDNQWFLKRKFN